MCQQGNHRAKLIVIPVTLLTPQARPRALTELDTWVVT